MHVNAADTAWVLVCTAMVLFMTPGLALFYGGMVRSKHVLSMLAQNFAVIAVISITWAVVGYSLAFSGDAGGGLIGNLHVAGLAHANSPLAGHRADRAPVGLRRVPDDVRRHHHRVADRRRRRPDALRPVPRLLGAVDGDRLRTAGALVVRAARLAAQARTARLRGWHSRRDQRRRVGAGAGPGARQAPGLAGRADATALAAPDVARCRDPLVRLVRLQRRVGAGLGRAGRPGADRHPPRGLRRLARLDRGREEGNRARDDPRRRLRCRRRPGRDHAGGRLRQQPGRDRHRLRRGRRRPATPSG